MAAETFAGSAARAAGAADNETTPSNHADAQGGGGTLPAIGGVQGRTGDDATVPGPTASGPAQAPSSLGDGSSAGNEKTPAATSNYSGDGGDAAMAARSSGAVGNQVVSQQAADSHSTEPQAPSVPEVMAGHDPTAPLGPVVGPIVGTLDSIVDHTVTPLVEAVGGVVGSLGSILGQTLEPVVELVGTLVGALGSIVEHVVAPVVALLGEVTEVLATTVEHVVAPVVGLVGDLLGSVVGSLTSVAESAVAPIGEAAEPLASVVGETVAPVASVVESVVAPLAETLGGILHPLGEIAGQHGIVASGGTIVVQEPPPIGGLHLDELFSQGSYTPYNLALGAASATTASATASASTSTIDALAADQHAGDSQHHESSSSATPPHGILGGVLDDLHLRGLHDGLGL